MKTYYSNFKYCTSEGKRVSVFAQKALTTFKDKERTEIFILECSKSDNFSRKRANEVYRNYLTLGRCFYTAKKTLVGQLNSSYEYIEHKCSPSIAELPMPLTYKALKTYLKSFLKLHIPYSAIKESVRSVVSDLERLGYYVEKERKKRGKISKTPKIYK